MDELQQVSDGVGEALLLGVADVVDGDDRAKFRTREVLCPQVLRLH